MGEGQGSSGNKATFVLLFAFRIMHMFYIIMKLN